MKEKLNIAETAARESSEQKEQFESLKKEHESLIGIAIYNARWRSKLRPRKRKCHLLKAELAGAEKKTDESASSTKGGQEAETEKENGMSALNEKIVELEKELLK